MQTKFNEMVLTLKKPGQDIIDSWTPAKASAAHMLTGLLDEFFELSEAAIEMYSCSQKVIKEWSEKEGR